MANMGAGRGRKNEGSGKGSLRAKIEKFVSGRNWKVRPWKFSVGSALGLSRTRHRKGCVRLKRTPRNVFSLARIWGRGGLRNYGRHGYGSIGAALDCSDL